MFAKLLKYEWRATSKVLGVLSLAALGAGALGAALLRMLNSVGDNLTLQIFGVLSMVVVVVALVAYGVAVDILLLARFYRNKFTDEGYLTFTLPVSNHQILLSSMVNFVVWTVIGAAVLLLAMGILILVGTAPYGLVNQEIIQEFRAAIPMLFRMMGADAWNLVLGVVNLIVSLFTQIAIMLTAITIGASIAKKHKILAAFGIYYGITAAIGILTSTTSIAVSAGSVSVQYATTASIAMVFQLVLNLALLVGGYLLTAHLMKNKLNLS